MGMMSFLDNFTFSTFHSITRKRLITVEISALLWGIASFVLVWCCFLGEWALPGESARALAVFSGADVMASPGYPALKGICHGVQRLFPAVSPVLLLNTLGALFSAMIAWLVFPIVHFWADDAMEEESAVVNASRVSLIAAHASLFVLVTARSWLLGAAYFIPGVWSVLLLLVAIRLLIGYARSGKAWRMCLFAFVHGVGMAESEVVLFCTPLLLLLVLVTEWRLWDRCTQHLGAWFIALVLGFLFSHTLRTWLTLPDFSLPEMGTTIINQLRAQVSSWRTLFRRENWFIVSLTGFCWSFIALLAARRTLNNERSWGQLFLMIILTIIGVLVVCHVPFTAWTAWLQLSTVPTLTVIVVAAGMGMLLAAWYAWFKLDDPAIGLEDSSVEKEWIARVSLACRTFSWIALPVAAAGIITGAVISFNRVGREHVDFGDRLADSILDRLENRYWFLTNSWIDPHLRLRAVLRGQPLQLISFARSQDAAYRKEVLEAVRTDPGMDEDTRLRLETLLAENFLMFVDDFFLAQPEAFKSTAVYNAAGVWYEASCIPRPECFFFGGVARLEDLAEAPLLANHQAFWENWEAFFTEKPEDWRITRNQQMRARMQAALVANNLGTIMEDLKRPEEAYLAYMFARKIAPENISALLNVFDLIFRSRIHPEALPELRKDVDRLVQTSERGRYPIQWVAENHGQIRNVELLASWGGSWVSSGVRSGGVLAALRNQGANIPVESLAGNAFGTTLAAIYEQKGDYEMGEKGYRDVLQANPGNQTAVSGLTRMVIQRGNFSEAKRILEAGSAAGLSRDDLLLDWAALYMVSGDLPSARKASERFLNQNLNRAQAWGLYGMILMEENNLSRVQNYVLPELEKRAKGEDLYFIHVLRGRLAQASMASHRDNAVEQPLREYGDTRQKTQDSEVKDALSKARAHYKRAYEIRPGARALLDMVLQLDIALFDQKNAEIDALTILRDRPEHPQANFIIGSMRLAQGHLESAIVNLRRGVSGEDPSSLAYINLAEALQRSGRFEEALENASKATESAPGFYASWATLAVIQARMGDLEQAKATLQKARALPGGNDDVRLALTDAWIAVGEKDQAAMTAALQRMDDLGEDLTEGDKKEMTAIRDAFEKNTR